MKNIFLYLVLLLNCLAYSQIEHPTYLSYNIIEDSNSRKKSIDDNGNIHFYLGKEHFEFTSKCIPEEVSNKELDGLTLIGINELLSIADNERKKLNKLTEIQNFVQIVFNNEIFKELYIIESYKGKIFRYKVFWHEEID